MIYACCEPRRLERIKLAGSVNAIEFLEVRDHEEPDLALRQRTLFVRLLRPGFTLAAEHVVIDGGERLPTIPIEWTAPADDLPAGVDPALVESVHDLPRTLVVRTTTSGDFSRYTLRLRASAGSLAPPDGFDPKLSSIVFSFKVECPSDFDCTAPLVCPPVVQETPDIDYLAKDYTGFRRLMLDRLNLVAPGWTERSAADVGMALIELVAYAADNLSYRQDAIANEAYLATAHRRVSVRRHARLVDYALHDGCNARAWVHLTVTSDHVLPAQTPLLTRTANLPVTLTPGSREVRDAIAGGALVFETARLTSLFADLNVLDLYAWGDQGCCLPGGATHATLRGHHPDLAIGDVLILQEVRNPSTFNEEDADPEKRWAVRLVDVQAGTDPSGQLFDDPPVDAALDITEIRWDAADALPFPLCLSVTDRPGLAISAAFGNVVLVDHGETMSEPAIGTVIDKGRSFAAPAGAGACGRTTGEPVHPRFTPTLAHAPITQRFDLAADLDLAPGTDADWWPASALIGRDPRQALPDVRLIGTFRSIPTGWTAVRDLLASDAHDTHFVVETENDGVARLRFGDDHHGRRPNAGTAFAATYRVGNGRAGNVGARAIAHIVIGAGGVFDAVTNPLPGAGGVDPEDIEAARRDAPEAFRTQERAVTAADYAAAAERRGDVQRAAATFRWTGSWHTVFVTADRFGGAPVDVPFEAGLRRHLERFRMAGYDLEVDGPRYVALDVAIHVCVKQEYFRSEVVQAVRAALGSGVLPDGRTGVFHPDNFAFGNAVYLSRIIAAAQAVEGVEAVWAQKFERMSDPDPAAIETGVIPMGRLEIAQLANNPSFRERGRLTIEAGGGK